MCISACPLARAHAHVCEWGLQGAGGTGRGGGGCFSVRVCVCVWGGWVCVCGCVYMVAILKVSRLGVCVCVCVCVCVYMVAILKVSRLAEREREKESQVCVYSHVASYKGVASS